MSVMHVLLGRAQHKLCEAVWLKWRPHELTL